MVAPCVDARVLSYRDGVPLLVAAMTGKLTAALPLDLDEEGEVEEAIHVAIGDGGALVLNRTAYETASADADGLTIKLGGVELQLSRT
jgi:hypothetical protein